MFIKKKKKKKKRKAIVFNCSLKKTIIRRKKSWIMTIANFVGTCSKIKYWIYLFSVRSKHQTPSLLHMYIWTIDFSLLFLESYACQQKSVAGEPRGLPSS